MNKARSCDVLFDVIANMGVAEYSMQVAAEHLCTVSTVGHERRALRLVGTVLVDEWPTEV